MTKPKTGKIKMVTILPLIFKIPKLTLNMKSELRETLGSGASQPKLESAGSGLFCQSRSQNWQKVGAGARIYQSQLELEQAQRPQT